MSLAVDASAALAAIFPDEKSDLEAGVRLATNDARFRNVAKKLGLAIFTTK